MKHNWEKIISNHFGYQESSFYSPKFLNFSHDARNDSRPQIESLNIDIKLKNFRKNEDRQQGLVMEFNQSKVVNARLNYQGKSYPANIDLKDLPDQGSIMNEFQDLIKGDESIRGMKRFSIHSPVSTVSTNKLIKIFRYHNTSTVPHKLLKVSVNGENCIMNNEEHMSKEYLEKQESKESLF